MTNAPSSSSDLNVADDRPVVGVNLTRLDHKSGGGAGLFGLSLARQVALQADAIVFVQASNAAAVRAGLGEACSATIVALDVKDGVEAGFAGQLDDLDIYIDPLNGLEPALLPPRLFSVTVIHDLLFMDRPYFFDAREIAFRRSHYGSAIDRASHVWTVSEAQVGKIKAAFGKAEVSAIHQPPHFSLLDQEASGLQTEGRRFLLYPAVQWNHKNHFRLFQAFAGLVAQKRIPDDVDLLFSGTFPREANASLHLQLIEALGLEARLRPIGYMSAPRYAAAMKACLGVVYPTLYEGWGAPVAEAAFNGVPILTSSCPSLLHAGNCGNLRLLSDPEDTDALARDLEAFIKSPPRRAAPRPIASAEGGFADSVRDIIETARVRRRARKIDQQPGRTPVVQRRQDGVTVLVVADKAPTPASQAALAKRFAGVDADLVLIAPFGGASAATPLRRHAYTTLADRDLAISYEFCLSRREVVITIPEAELRAFDVSMVGKAASLFRHYPDLRAANCMPSTATRLTGRLGAAVSGRAIRSSAAAPDLDATPDGLVGRLSQLATPDLIGRKLVIIDPSLKDKVGHHAAVARSLARGARAQGLAPLVLAHHLCPPHLIEPDGQCQPCFDDYLYGGIGDVGLFAYQLEKACAAVAAGAEDVLTLFCATPAMLAGAVGFMLRRPREDRPRISIRFDRDASRTPGGPVSYARSFDLINRFGLREHFNFFVESIGLQTYFEGESGERFPFLFNPLPKGEAAGLIFDDATQEQSNRITIGYLGEARVEKGFHVVPFIVDYLLSQPDLADRIQFFIQTGAGPLNQHEWVLGAQAEIERRAELDPRITTRRFLSEIEYAKAVDDIDIALLPYGPPDYAMRGSGVATETAAAAKLMVCSLGLDLAETFEGAGVVMPVVQNELGLAEAAAHAVREYDALKARAQSFRAENADLFTDDAQFVRRLSTEGRGASTGRGAVLWISNDTRGEGSGVVYDSQLAYLTARGYAPIQIVAPYPSLWSAENETLFDLGQFLATLEFKPHFRNDANFHAALALFEGKGNSYEAFTRAWGSLIFPAFLEGAVQALDLGFAVINYAHHARAIEVLTDGTTLPRICEAHDIQAYQYAIQQNRPVNPQEVQTELRHLAAFDQVVSISAVERDVIAEAVGQDKAVWRLPFVESTRERVLAARAAAPGYGSVDEQELVETSADEADTPLEAETVDDGATAPEDSLETTGILRLDGPVAPATVRRTTTARPETDLLIVGSLHDANLVSARWFIQSVYRPILYDKGVTLRIVGKVNEALDTGYLADRIDYAGWVADLDAEYEAARVVALPIVAGAGVPIKVLDAFARGRPFSMMDFPVRAIGLPNDFPACSSAVDMASDILGLLADPARREERAGHGLAFYRNHASRAGYFETWDRVVAALGERTS